MHALYGFARYADEIVDDLDDDRPIAAKAAQLDALDGGARAGALDGDPTDRPGAGRAGRHRPPLRHRPPALHGLPGLDADGHHGHRLRRRSPSSAVYVHGSAAVIGLQMLPILGTRRAARRGRAAAAALGVAFQLTNFLRDVGEDLDRGRVYLPADELAAFGVDRELLRWCRRTGGPIRGCAGRWPTSSPTPAAVYRRAEPGIAMLEPVVAGLRALRVHALRGHPRRDRDGRLRRAAPAGRASRTGDARPSHCRARPGPDGAGAHPLLSAGRRPPGRPLRRPSPGRAA